PWPKELTIKLSCDAWHWQVVYDTGRDGPDKDGEPIQVKFSTPTPAKQLWIIANHLPSDNKNDERDYVFSFAGVRAITDNGENAALLSRGAGVTASSTNANGG